MSDAIQRVKYVSVGVIGAGVMGSGLAQTLAQTRHRVVLVDLTEEILERARAEISKNLRFATLFDFVLREAGRAAIIDRIELTTDYGRLLDVDFVIENTTESWAVKQSIYPQLDRICRADCILAANTSAISITRLAATTERPDRVIGIHFMNPVPQKQVVEVIRGQYTGESTVRATTDFLREMGKRAILVKDTPGFVTNRVLMLAINEAIRIVQEDVATPADVDEIFVKCLAHKMGPLATADLIGLDTVLLSLEVLDESYNDGRFRPCPLLKQMVDAGRHGRKSGRGFFDYTGQKDSRWA
jgi:3-hydroxybutyryl-CoA dehydrogenase